MIPDGRIIASNSQGLHYITGEYGSEAFLLRLQNIFFDGPSEIASLGASRASN
jgi:hypothetical protein